MVLCCRIRPTSPCFPLPIDLFCANHCFIMLWSVVSSHCYNGYHDSLLPPLATRLPLIDGLIMRWHAKSIQSATTRSCQCLSLIPPTTRFVHSLHSILFGVHQHLWLTDGAPCMPCLLFVASPCCLSSSACPSSTFSACLLGRDPDASLAVFYLPVLWPASRCILVSFLLCHCTVPDGCIM